MPRDPRKPVRSALERRWPLALAAIGALAFTWRAFYLARLAASPLGGSLTADSVLYWDWAAFLVRHGPIGAQPFFLGPLYPYALAGFRVVFGDAIAPVLWAQAAWGSLAAVLLADAARRLTRPAIGLAIGVWIALHEMAVFFDGLVLMESLLFFLGALLLWWTVRLPAADRARDWAVAGALVALLAEGRAVMALLLLPVAWLAATRGGRARLAALGAGFLLIAAPVALRNLAVSGEWIPFTYNLGINLYVGNHPGATGGFMEVTGTHDNRGVGGNTADGGVAADGRAYLLKTEGLHLGPNASSRHWQSKAIAYAREHPGATARGALRKLGMLLNRREYPQIENADQFRALAGPLGIPWVGSFAALGALGIAGMLFAWRAGPGGRFLLGYAAVMTAGVLPFFVVDRYRHHLVPAMALLAALALERLVAARIGTARLAVVAAIAAGLVVTHLPAPEISRGREAWAMDADLGSRWLDRGRPDLALAGLERAIAALARDPGSDAIRGERGALFYNYGLALTRVGRAGQALAWFERAAREAPGSAEIARALAGAYAAAGHATAADSVERRLPELVGGGARLFDLRARAAARSGDLEGAEGMFEEAVKLDDRQWASWEGLIRARIQRGRVGAADTALARARDAGLPQPTADAYAALIAAMLDDADGARRALSRIPVAALRDSSLLEVVELARGRIAR